MFISGIVRTTSPFRNLIKIETKTEFHQNGIVKIVVVTEENEEFELLIRNPEWSEKTLVSVDDDGHYTFADMICKLVDGQTTGVASVLATKEKPYTNKFAAVHVYRF